MLRNYTPGLRFSHLGPVNVPVDPAANPSKQPSLKVSTRPSFWLHGALRNHMCPQPAVPRRVRITFLVRVLMMDSMCCYPGDRPTFERQRTAQSKEVLQPFRCLIAAMREQSVIAHADPQTTGNPPQRNRQDQSLPRKYGQRDDRADMKVNHEQCSRPNNWLSEGLISMRCSAKVDGDTVECSASIRSRNVTQGVRKRVSYHS
jgi:hypothetical protein